jgi:nitrogen fixation protein
LSPVVAESLSAGGDVIQNNGWRDEWNDNPKFTAIQAIGYKEKVLYQSV